LRGVTADVGIFARLKPHNTDQQSWTKKRRILQAKRNSAAGGTIPSLPAHPGDVFRKDQLPLEVDSYHLGTIWSGLNLDLRQLAQPFGGHRNATKTKLRSSFSRETLS